MQEEIEKRTWYERVADSLDFSGVARGAGIAFDTELEWVLNVLRELSQQAMPLADIRRPEELTPRKVGRIAGQMCGGMYAIGETFVAGLEAASQKREVMEMCVKHLEENQHLPLFKSGLQAVEFCGQGVGALAEKSEDIEKAVLEGFKSALDQPSRTEAAEYFRGFAEGIAKPGLTPGKPSLAGATTATPIYFRLFVHRREIEQLKSVRELREFLLHRGLSEQVLGDPKRLEKICERIDLSFGKRGRRKCTK